MEVTEFKKRRRFNHTKKFPKKFKKSDLCEIEIEELEENLSKFSANSTALFSDFPLSSMTKKGLEKCNYKNPTEIQRQTILHAVKGENILAAAKTGSGKTLAFIIPILENLYKLKLSATDGVGAIIITPTRELAFQIFEVLKKVGKFHDFSAGLVIGGKTMEEEKRCIANTNIVVSTPGRLLHHMDQTPGFFLHNLQMLILDEADRMLDMGFEKELTAILDNLPDSRQNLLYSATQTKSVKSLVRLNMKKWIFISDLETSKHSTPDHLRQSYIVCPVDEKLNFIYSFIKFHLKQKILIFLTCCKQVRFVYEVFCHLRPGVTILALHGAMTQMKRFAMYEKFLHKQSAVLFSTDIAARGLDFPAVNWVVQLDCPSNTDTYIHRAGRTARYETDGESLLVLHPSEEAAMLKQLLNKKVPITKIRSNSKKLFSINKRLESFCASNVSLKEFAQRAFVSFLKSYFLMPDKEIFDVSKIDTAKLAASFGLAIEPRVRIVSKAKNKSKKSESQKDTFLNNNNDDQSSEMMIKDVFNDEEDDDIFIKHKKSSIEDSNFDELKFETNKKEKGLTKIQLAKKILKKPLQHNTKIVFNDDDDEDSNRINKINDSEVLDVNKRKEILLKADAIDRKNYKDKLLMERRLKKDKLRKQKELLKSQNKNHNAVLSLNNKRKSKSDKFSESDDTDYDNSDERISKNDFNITDDEYDDDNDDNI